MQKNREKKDLNRLIIIIPALIIAVFLFFFDKKLTFVIAISLITYYDRVIFERISEIITFLNFDKEIAALSIFLSTHYFGPGYGCLIMAIVIFIHFLHQDIRNIWQMVDYASRGLVIILALVLVPYVAAMQNLPYIMAAGMVVSMILRQFVLDFDLDPKVLYYLIEDFFAFLIYLAAINLYKIV